MIGILNYGMGNLRSVANALSFLGVEFAIISTEEDIRRADKIILPGVGAFAAGLENLKKLGFIPVLHEEVMDKQKPILGICLGMQLFAERGFEGGEHAGLGWIPGEIRKLTPPSPALKIPHMGWSHGVHKKPSPLFRGIAPQADFYFVHSYYLVCEPELVTSTCEYGIEFPASIEWRNVFGTQFHPEKSQDAGLTLLKNFAALESN